MEMSKSSVGVNSGPSYQDSDWSIRSSPNVDHFEISNPNLTASGPLRHTQICIMRSPQDPQSRGGTMTTIGSPEVHQSYSGCLVRSSKTKTITSLIQRTLILRS